MSDQPNGSTQSINKILNAIYEINAKRNVLSEETYATVHTALHDKLRKLQSVAPAADATQISEQIRLVTVMFVDVVDATRLEQTLGTEDWRKLIAAGQQRIASTVRHWDGEIGQYLGDGVLCYFGAHHSQGKDATRAVSCALAIQERVAYYSDEAKAIYPKVEAFQIRIGISTGLVVVGPVGGAESLTTLAIGGATNRAARLQAIIAADTVAIDDDTYQRVRGDFVIGERIEASLKGFDQLVPYYLVDGQKRTTTTLTTECIGDITIPFVGRKDIRAQIATQAREVTTQRHFRSVLVYGEVGLGKSRLLQQIALEQQQTTFYTIHTKGHYERTETAFSLVRDILHNLCDLASVSTKADIEQQIITYTQSHWHGDAHSARSIAEIIGYVGGYGFSDSSQVEVALRNASNSTLYSVVLRWLRGIADKNPILLLVDDLQWVDSQSLATLEYLARDTDGILLVSACEPSFLVEHPDYMQPQPHHISHELTPLSAEETKEVLTTVLSRVEGVPATLADSLSNQAQGTPLFLEEFLRLIFNDRVVTRIDESNPWKFNNIAYQELEGQLPSGLHGVIQARLDNLGTETRRVAQIAATFGQAFWAGGVQYVMGNDIEAHLGQLVAAGITIKQLQSRVTGESEYAFRNTLYRNVAYSMLPRNLRETYHRQVVAWFERHALTHPDLLGILAGHYQTLDSHMDALKIYATVARAQLERQQLMEAVRFVEAGLSIASHVTRLKALPYVSRLWLVQAQIAYARRNYAEATAAGETAIRLIHELPQHTMTAQLVTANITLGNAFTSLGNYDKAMSVLAEAYYHVADDTNPVQKAQVLRSFGRLHWSRGELRRATMFQQQALSTARQATNKREVIASLSMLGRVALDRGDFATSLDYFEHVLRYNRKSKNAFYEVYDLQLLAVIHRVLFRYDRALQLLDEAETLATQINHVEPMLAAQRGLCYIAQQRHAEGLALLNSDMSRGIVNTHERYIVRLAYVRGLAQAGEYDQCLTEGQSFLAAVESHNRVLHGRGLLWVGMAQYKTQHADALQTLHTALEKERSFGGRDLWLCYQALSLTQPDADDAAESKRKAQETLQAIGSSLYRRPDLAKSVTYAENIAQVFKAWYPPASTLKPE